MLRVRQPVGRICHVLHSWPVRLVVLFCSSPAAHHITHISAPSAGSSGTSRLAHMAMRLDEFQARRERVLQDPYSGFSFSLQWFQLCSTFTEGKSSRGRWAFVDVVDMRLSREWRRTSEHATVVAVVYTVPRLLHRAMIYYCGLVKSACLCHGAMTKFWAAWMEVNGCMSRSIGAGSSCVFCCCLPSAPSFSPLRGALERSGAWAGA